jgi:SAM-dependent methyltransferase
MRAVGPLPPKELIGAAYIGGGDFTEIGETFVRYFIELCQLESDERVIDVGCGLGRMAIPLTAYLTRGTYHGLDVNQKSIEWCRENISGRQPNFEFEWIDIFSRLYNPDGAIKAEHYTFPFPDERFDFAYLVSVFTHMHPPGVERYLSEIARILRPGGRVLATFCTFDDESLELVLAGRNRYPDLARDLGGYRQGWDGEPEALVAYDEVHVRDLYERFGLKLRDPIHYGSWTGRDNALTFQDVLIADRQAP